MTISPIPTTLITGTLGAGKTTTIRHLLQQKPINERWAILVNEFGKVGIDGAIFQQSQQTTQDSLIIREIAGGCICCSANMLMQVTLARLIRETRPDRIIIEPTGISHPQSILDLYHNPDLSPAITPTATLCITDARLHTPEYITQSETYRDQLALADIIVINKTDLTPPEMTQTLTTYLNTLTPPKLAIIPTTQGQLNFNVLTHPPRPLTATPHPTTTHAQQTPTTPTTLINLLPSSSPPQKQLKRFESEGFGRKACGWIFPPDVQFCETALMQFFTRLNPQMERAKGIFHTGDQWQLIHLTTHNWQMEQLQHSRDSRIELISAEGTQPDWDSLETQLIACQIT